MKNGEQNGWRVFTLEDAYADRRPESAEEAYRRGYADGWIKALDAMHDAMFGEHAPRQAAYDRLWTFWEHTLSAWRRGDCSKTVFPPEPERELSE